MNAPQISYFVKRDWDGFFGLFVDNLVQLLLIVSLCSLCGIAADSDLMVRSILPGAALSIVIGNLFYAWQALQLARKEQRDDVTALPYGINTPSLLVYVFFVMVPVYQRTNSPEQAWKMGLLACLGSGIIEFIGSFVAEGIRRRTPRAALLSTLAGIAIGFIAMTFALQIFQRPLIAMLPLAIVLVTYFSHVPFPGGLPGGLVAVLMGTLCAWLLPLVLPVSLAGPPMSVAALTESWGSRGWYVPQLAVVELFDVLRQPGEWIGFLSVIVPMGLFNVIGSLQNIESAEAAGDRYHTQSSLAVNGLGTILAACFGSCFPTTIYIGHPGWKQLGARAGYSTLNGLAIVLICLTGTVGFISRLIPLEAGIAIVLWIGIIITAQAFQTTPIQHAPAVAVGLFPAIAAWGATVTHGAFMAIGLRSPAAPTMQMLLNEDIAFTVNGFLLHGLLLMERGYIFSCMLLAAICAFLIDRRFNAAALWSLVAAIFAWVGLTHAYQLSGNTYDYLFVLQEPVANATAMRAHGIAVGYLLFALFFFLMGRYQSSRGDAPLTAH
ncbi:MAG: NCS2 family permease [Planctomycetaceae bacterium]